MKKIITLALVLVFALSLAVPALAYTNNVAPAQGVSPYVVDIYLVEHDGGDNLTNIISMPPTNRGYAKNEIVAAVGALTVPKDAVPFDDFYRRLRFSADNVNFFVTDNKLAGNPATGFMDLTQSNTLRAASFVAASWTYNIGDMNVDHAITNNAGVGVIPKSSSDKTYRWLIFGKVTDDDATMSFALSRAAGFVASAITADVSTLSQGVNFTNALVLNEDYIVARINASGQPTTYMVFENSRTSLNPATPVAGDRVFSMQTLDAKGKTGRLHIYPNGIEYRVLVEPSTQELVFVVAGPNLPGSKQLNDQIKFGTPGYTALRAFYDENVEKLGFSAYNEGNVLKDSDWTGIAAAAWDVKDTVDVEPWTPYVVVPDNIVVNPPKTGDVASFVGFALIALAGLAVAVVRKVRA